jgi:hypothetical protein
MAAAGMSKSIACRDAVDGRRRLSRIGMSLSPLAQTNRAVQNRIMG